MKKIIIKNIKNIAYNLSVNVNFQNKFIAVKIYYFPMKIIT